MKSEELPLTTSKPEPLVVQEPSVSGMLGAFIERGVTSENVAAFAQLIELKERIDRRDGEKAFNSAFAKLQCELPVIVAESVIPNRGKYARFENVMHQIQPMLTGNGFAVSFEQSADDKRIKVTCHLRHTGGHSQATSFSVRLGGKADSDTQADCKASTTAKRNALLQALNIVIRQDCLQDEDDAHNEGGDEVITAEECAELIDWVESTDSDKEEFLKFAKAASFAEIRSSDLDRLHTALRRKEKAR